MLLPNGATGALWRGLVYPVGDHNDIDIAGEAVPPAACVAERARPPESLGFASIQGVDEVYLLLSGPIAVREAAAASLRAAGIAVLRAGRYLGDPVDGFAADWFVRFERPPGGEAVDSVLSRILGAQRVAQQGEPEAASEIRQRLLQEELAAARLREAGLRSELASARAAAAQSNVIASEGELRSEIPREQQLRYEAEAARAAAEAALETAQAESLRARQPARRTRLQDEIAVVLEALLPNLALLKDSLTVVAVEYTSRKALYRALAELAHGDGRLPANWKAVQGATGWWERHVSDGQDNTGRLYASFASKDRRWDVLISDKGEQARDMAWLRRYSVE